MITGLASASAQPSDGRRERQRGEQARDGLHRRLRHRDRPQAGLARDVDRGQLAVAGDVVGARRPGAEDAQPQRLADVPSWMNCSASGGDRHRQRDRQPQREVRQAPRERLEGAGTKRLGADRVRPEHDRRAQDVEPDLRMQRRRHPAGARSISAFSRA